MFLLSLKKICAFLNLLRQTVQTNSFIVLLSLTTGITEIHI